MRSNNVLQKVQNLLAWLLVAILFPLGLVAMSRDFYRGLVFLLLACVVCPKTPLPLGVRLILTVFGVVVCRIFF